MKTINSKAVEFSCRAPKAKAVFVAGTFNDWKPDAAPMHNHLPKGKWTVTLPLPPGRYEFKFVVDGQWCCDPGCAGDHACPNASRTNSAR
jgi:1,4-alpha-glucan branching enzyme